MLITRPSAEDFRESWLLFIIFFGLTVRITKNERRINNNRRGINERKDKIEREFWLYFLEDFLVATL